MSASDNHVVEIPPPTPEFLNAIEALGIIFEPDDLERIEGYLRLLYEANQVMNLTGVRDPADAWMRHIFDSLTLLPWISGLAAEGRDLRILDVGSGGGCPGIPLACILPQAHITLLETTGKKADFLSRAALELGLAEVTVLQERAEVAGQEEDYRGVFDVVISRAVGRLPVLLEFTVPFATEGGIVLAIKGEQAEQEINEARQAFHMLHSAVVETRKTPTGTVIVIEKQRKTPGKYPRPSGEPKRNPLGSS